MTTEDLIAALSLDAQPVRPGAVAGRLAFGLAAGALLAAVLLLFSLGPRPDLMEAMEAGAFWMKWAYVAGLAAAALVIVRRLARPGGRVGWAWVLLAAPVGVMVAMGGLRLLQAPEEARMALWLGGSWRVCPLRIAAFALPAFAGLVWGFRRLAPTRLRLAGFVAGVAAGGVGALVYALHCDESAAPFIATWYTLGVMITGAAGALVGPRLLRW